MINVLVFDDRWGARTDLLEGLEKSFKGQVDLDNCRSVYEANDAIEQKKYHVIIIDSMMSTNGLKPELEKYTKGGLLTGIVWLCNIHNEKPERLQDTSIFVYSGYLDDCDEDTMQALNEYTQNDNFIKNSITFVSKTGNNRAALIEAIREKYKLSKN